MRIIRPTPVPPLPAADSSNIEPHGPRKHFSLTEDYVLYPASWYPALRSYLSRYSLIALLLLALAAPAQAYVGPGAGVALVGSFMVILVTMFMAVLIIMALPFRILWRTIKYRGKAKPKIRRLVIVGLDGQEPRLTERYMKEGKLPNFQKLADSGSYNRLETTYPAISPVAWSSFATGSNPAKHNIFDFLDRDLRTYLPVLSSAKIGAVERFLKLGKMRIPLQKPELRLLRRSKPFWSILGDHHIWSTVLRVPITFPPDKFYGAELSAMSVPDLLGTQGTFFLYTTRSTEDEIKEGGERLPLKNAGGNRYEGQVEGPENSFFEGDPKMVLDLVIEADPAAKRARVTIGKESWDLAERELSEWLPLGFKAAPGVTVTGLVRMQLTEVSEEHVQLYMTPMNLDPENPAMPISHPDYYSNYLAKKVGPYATLGLAEDTTALNEDVIDDATFLKMSYDIDKEREDQLFSSLDKIKKGVVCCVFDGTDRIQHMFWRYTEDGHPAAEGRDRTHADAIEKLYEHNDALLGRVMGKLNDDDVLIVLSDHGFTSFRRGINLNSWLLENGYLKLKEGADGSAEWLRDVDWSQTKAYSVGMTGMFLNMKDREGEGIVAPGEEAEAVKAEIIEKLSGLVDDERGDVSITEVFDTRKIYSGPYIGNAPDMIIGYNEGYRVSWDGATGVCSGPVFTDNTKAWSGDHGIDPRQVPGVLFMSHGIDADDPAIIDLAPTVLRLFGITPPAHMDGKELYNDYSKFNKGKGRPAAPANENQEKAADGKDGDQAAAMAAVGAPS